MQTLSDIITSIHGSSDSEKGRLFELLCLYFLRHDKLHKSLYSDARLWKDSPIANGQPDTGIDIVAKLRDSDSYCAVQCKFRDDDSSITKAELDSFLAASSKAIYSRRILFTLTGNFGRNARDTLSGQVPPVTCLTLRDLDRSTLDWSAYPENVSYTVKTLLPHQTQAVDAVIEGFSHSDRGKLIMACGTGKTLTSQRIAERYAGKGGLVLVLVPSISLLNQSLLAWNYDSDEAIPLRSFAVCSDATVGRKDYPDEDMKLSDLVIPPTTDAVNLVREFTPDSEAMTVIFSTYQSLQVISDAQKNGLPEFDIVICDEAHRTAGTASADSYFRLVHDNDFIHSRKRLYMTATPKIFTENLKAKAQDDNILLCSMDNAEIYGPEFFRLSFSQAVEQNLLTDYKVMVFMVEKDNPDEPDMPAIVQGVSRALAKDISTVDEDFLESDTSPMHRAVAFASTIAASKEFASFADRFTSLTPTPSPLAPTPYPLATRHIDGKDSSAKRSSSLQWLKDESPACRILSNARCLCEGVDVPALDAVIFISPKSSEIDIVQSVGRVMRKSPGKKYGYVILPVIVKPGETPEEALDNNDSYRTVWKVLQALRAHDDHFNAVINSLDFGGSSAKIRVLAPGSRQHHEWLNDDLAEKYRQQIYIRMVRKCGDREYWSSWVADLVNAFQAISARITSAIPTVREDFDSFTQELRAAINPSISPEQAVEMLAQHITSKEVFDAIFTGFADYNPVSQSMQKMRAILEASGADLDPRGLEKFNEHVRDKARSASTGEAKQKLLRNIYENFFAQAFSRTAKTLGIVYTPEQIVDFIIRSADWAARDLLSIDGGLSAEGVHILDPFSGTGTFTARLIQLGIIPPEKLYAKYTREIHANEILLLAYYISAVNIEAAYNQMAGGFYTEFPGMVLADTFRLN
ncbi:MAG: DEAD/DEAH box helicase, partial [Synergistaceae bacterium]|nr:DEAD/DEAH box helicase [Synergistaceae bacterium]